MSFFLDTIQYIANQPGYSNTGRYWDAWSVPNSLANLVIRIARNHAPYSISRRWPIEERVRSLFKRVQKERRKDIIYSGQVSCPWPASAGGVVACQERIPSKKKNSFSFSVPGNRRYTVRVPHCTVYWYWRKLSPRSRILHLTTSSILPSFTLPRLLKPLRGVIFVLNLKHIETPVSRVRSPIITVWYDTIGWQTSPEIMSEFLREIIHWSSQKGTVGMRKLRGRGANDHFRELASPYRSHYAAISKVNTHSIIRSHFLRCGGVIVPCRRQEQQCELKLCCGRSQYLANRCLYDMCIVDQAMTRYTFKFSRWSAGRGISFSLVPAFSIHR